MTVNAEFQVSGMTCQHCVNAVTEEVTAIEGVTNTAVDLNPEGVSTVSVTSESPVSREQVAAAVEEAGYELV